VGAAVDLVAPRLSWRVFLAEMAQLRPRAASYRFAVLETIFGGRELAAGSK